MVIREQIESVRIDLDEAKELLYNLDQSLESHLIRAYVVASVALRDIQDDAEEPSFQDVLDFVTVIVDRDALAFFLIAEPGTRFALLCTNRAARFVNLDFKKPNETILAVFPSVELLGAASAEKRESFILSQVYSGRCDEDLNQLRKMLAEDVGYSAISWCLYAHTVLQAWGNFVEA